MHPTGEIKLRDIRVDSDSVGQNGHRLACREIGVRQTAALEMRPWLARAAIMIQSRKGAFHRNTLALPIALSVVLLGIRFAANLDGKA
jgi:hypothetical protein